MKLERHELEYLAIQDDGGDVDDSNSSDVHDIGVSYDSELNLSTSFEPTSFEEVVSHDEWK
jgi:hypothetical protein